MTKPWIDFIKELSSCRYEVNNLPTDFSQSGRYLTDIVKHQFQINEVPVNIANALKNLNTCLLIAEDTYEETVDLITAEIKKQIFPNQCPTKIFED